MSVKQTTMEGNWDDLFALAAGDNSSLENLNSVSKILPRSESIKTKRKKRKIATTTSDVFQHMLSSRMSSDAQINFGKCHGDIQRKDIWYMGLYYIVCKIRRYALDNAMKMKNQSSNWDALTSDISIFKDYRFPSLIDSGEKFLLEEKKQALWSYVSRKQMTFPSWVRSIIACDDLYFRLYYLQISGLLPSQEGAYLPHPVSHFTSFDDETDGINQSLLAKLQQIPSIMARFGLRESDDHPLAKLYHIRLRESHRLFSKRLDASETMKALEETNVHPPTSLDYHTTVASPILQEWRDSCRDDLCHLYCYATISKPTLQKVVSWLMKLKVTNILELGAGTGYIAKLLQAFLPVAPYDIHPTTSSYNEYHGRIPPFIPVFHGTYDTVRHLLDSSCALLLCYPPPQTSMAYDAVKSIWGNHSSRDITKKYDSNMARVIVHIGEWKGLTGTKSFEYQLEQSGICIFRAPCWTWGTDAADVTIWCHKGNTSVSSLVTPNASNPCIHCQKQDAIRRCRLLRIAVYCSRKCWESDRPQNFSILCQLSLIPDDLPLEWDNRNHFMIL
jgi:hypothetical protein